MKKILCILLLAVAAVAWKAVGNAFIPDVVTQGTRLELITHDTREGLRPASWVEVLTIEDPWVRVQPWSGAASPKKDGAPYWLNLADVRGFRVLR